MRRETRKNNRGNKKYDIGNTVLKYVGTSIIVITLVLIGILAYNKKIDANIKKNNIQGEEFAKMISSENKKQENKSKKVNSNIGKTVDESLKEYEDLDKEKKEKVGQKNEQKDKQNNQQNNEQKNIVKKDEIKNKTKIEKEKKDNNITNNKKTNKKEEENIKKDDTRKTKLEFIKPVEGEIIKDFSVDNLIFSNTLQEWTTHTGIDIKADKTTVVKSAEKGIVKSIKNDPRFGLSIIVEHENGFQTVYANLLTSEFVIENEKVEKGQSLGTVGNTSSFEIADEPHLHFEIIKDSICVDPKIYIK